MEKLLAEDGQLACSSTEWAVKNVVQDVGEPIDALCTNKNFDLLAVAGRSGIRLNVEKYNNSAFL
jgi:hypothetical protein